MDSPLQQYLQEFVQGTENVVIYGAGHYGRKLVKHLKRLEQITVVLLDDSKCGEVESVAIRKDYLIQKNDLVIIPLENLQQAIPIAQNLYRAGVADVRLLSNRLREHLDMAEEPAVAQKLRQVPDVWARIKAFSFSKLNTEYVRFSLNYILTYMRGYWNSSATVSCPICSGTAALHWVNTSGYRIYECERCGHVFVANPPCFTSIESFYSGYDYFLQNCAHQGITSLTDDSQWQGWLSSRIHFLEFFGLLHDFSNTPATVLEVGCSEGKLLEYLKKQGHSVFGCDVNTELAAYASSTFGIDIRCGTLADAGFETGTFDVIIAIHTVEHLTDPVGDLIRCRDLLKPGGRLLIEIPIGETDYNNPHHLHFFNERSIHLCLKTIFGDFSVMPSCFADAHGKYCATALAVACRR